MPRDQWKRIVDSGFVAIVTVLAFLSYFVWRLLTSESDVKSHQKVQIGCFTSPSIRRISQKQSFLVYFQLGIISWKKKKKKTRYWAYVDVVLIITLSILATCLVSSNCSVTHVRWGEGTSSVLFQWRPAFSALWRRGNSVVSVHHINNFWNTRSNLTKLFRAVAATAANGVCKITCETVENWLRYQRKTLHRRCHNVGSVFCINNFWSTQSNSVKFTGQLP